VTITLKRCLKQNIAGLLLVAAAVDYLHGKLAPVAVGIL